MANNVQNPKEIIVPNSTALQLATEVSGSSKEAADYFAEQFKKILINSKMLNKPEAQEMLARVEDFAKYVGFKLSLSTQPWSGEQGKPSDFKNMQDQLAKDASAFVTENIKGNLKLDFAINEKGQLLRGYSVDGEMVNDPNRIEALDKLFNAWLAEHNIVSQGSILYESDINGVKQNPANAEKIKNLIKGVDNGFASYMGKKNNHSIQIENHEYPKAQEQVKPQTTQQPTTSVEVEEKPSPESPISPS